MGHDTFPPRKRIIFKEMGMRAGSPGEDSLTCVVMDILGCVADRAQGGRDAGEPHSTNSPWVPSEFCSGFPPPPSESRQTVTADTRSAHDS